MILKIQEQFQSGPDWYRRDGVRVLVASYYVVLRSVLHIHLDLRRCLCRCRECGIFFLTHPRNAGRRDLRCPFGCREMHRRRKSSQRSAAYYRTEHGKGKKKDQNDKRRRGSRGPSPRRPPGEHPRMHFDADIVRYLAMLVSGMERRRVSQRVIRKMLARAVRQHRIAKRRRIDYVLDYLENNSS